MHVILWENILNSFIGIDFYAALFYCREKFDLNHSLLCMIKSVWLLHVLSSHSTSLIMRSFFFV